MLLIIDYDNVDQKDRHFGIEHVVRKILALCDQPERELDRVTVRLYGGWHEGGMPTRVAQKLDADIQKCSPINLSRNGTAVLIYVELAASILADSRTIINNTFRKKGYPRNIVCESRPWLQCQNNDTCPLRVLDSFLNDNLCVQGQCSVQPAHVLQRNEQKVVDTMMVADIIFAAQNQQPWLAVVSRDDDVWPGLSIASMHAEVLTHLPTNSAQRLPNYYGRLRAPPYRRVYWG